MSLSPGTRLGPYEVRSAIGAGGMGEVFRATDTRLKREVAIKVLPRALASDPARLSRFQREAEVLASLNHPHIAAIYGLEEADGLKALVLELVDGDTLADRIARGPLPVDEALAIARQIAEALDAAHEKGIVHRDLKPANVKLTADGQVKVLDFGLARAMAADSSDAGVSMSPTMTSPAMTQMGVILGTAAYMSPEQARGRAVDARADIWAFGVVLYEMVTGTALFAGDTVTDVLAAVVTKEPDWGGVPAPLIPLLRRCLEKDPKRRLRHIGDLDLLLPALPAAPPPPRGGSLRRVVAERVALLAAGALLTAGAVWALWPTSQAPRLSRFEIVPPADRPLALVAADRNIAISPDGSHVVYRVNAGQPELVVRALDQLEVRPLTDTSRGRSPFMSPDGLWVGFFSGAEIRKVSITGGPATVVTFITTGGGGARGASWGEDGNIVFATTDPGQGLMIVPAGGGEVKELTRPDSAAGEVDHQYPSMLPGGRAVLFTITAPGSQLEKARIAVLDLATREYKVLIEGGSQPEYVETGHIVYTSGDALRAVRFDPNRLEVLSGPVPVVDEVVTGGTGGGNFAMSRTGTLVYIPGSVIDSGSRNLVWVNRQGQEEPLGAPPRAYQHVSVSPDGSRAALELTDQDQDIWVWEMSRKTLTKLTFAEGQERFPTWTPDGRFVAFSSPRDGIAVLHMQAADGTGTARPFAPASVGRHPTSFSPDGKRLVVHEVSSAQEADLGMVELDRIPPPAGGTNGPAMISLIKSLRNELHGMVSSDGRWLAYESMESGQREVYVRPFPNVNDGYWQVSSSGATRPVWARNGRELFYLDAANTLTAVPVQTAGAAFSAGRPSKVFDGKYYAPQFERAYDVSPDGRRFLMVKEAPSSQGALSRMVVVLNWFEELKRLVPVK